MNMRKGENKKHGGFLGLLVLAVFSLVLLPAVGRAACPSTATTDADNDGFTEAQECGGISLVDGSPSPVYLDPARKDLFVIIVPLSTGSLIPTTVQPPKLTSSIDNKLGINTYLIYASPNSIWVTGNRQVTSSSPQKAVRVTENADGTLKDSSNNYLPFGNSNYGTPNNLDGATVWTQRIKNYISTVACPSSVTSCTDSVSGAVGTDAVTSVYIRNTIPHEVGHVMKLTSSYNSKYGGYHYATGSNIVMEQSVVYKNNKGTVTFYIPSAYASGDAAAATLK